MRKTASMENDQIYNLKVASSNKNISNFRDAVFRINPDLKPFITIIGIGFDLLLDSWEFPPVKKDGAKSIRISLTQADRDALNYLKLHSGKTAAEIVAAALIRAKNSKVRPRKKAAAGIYRSSSAKPIEEL
jgi:hypothetical protein